MTELDDGLRAKCIDAMEIAADNALPLLFDRLNCPISDDDFRAAITAAFDALHGTALVVPPVATKEMLLAASAFDENSQQVCRAVFHKMAAAGDLTGHQDKMNP